MPHGTHPGFASSMAAAVSTQFSLNGQAPWVKPVPGNQGEGARVATMSATALSDFVLQDSFRCWPRKPFAETGVANRSKAAETWLALAFQLLHCREITLPRLPLRLHDIN